MKLSETSIRRPVLASVMSLLLLLTFFAFVAAAGYRYKRRRNGEDGID